MYLNQDIQVKWGKDTSNAFGGVNGVRQGGVLSPILFTVYLDMLISELKSCGAGCWLGHHYYGGLVSADDISLLSPSVTGLQRMVDVCAKFGLKYSILFNEKKSVCIKYSADQDDLPDIILNGKVLKWEMKVKHLGNVLNNRLTDIDDILLKKQQFFQQANKVKSDFQGVRWDVLTQLFTKYCSSFYGSQSWELRSEDFKGLQRSWNRAVRVLLQLPYNSHCFFLPLLLNVQALEVQLMRRFLKMCVTMQESQNEKVSFLIRYCVKCANSMIARNLFFICSKYNCNLDNVICNRYKVKQAPSERELVKAEFVKELLNIRDNIMTVDGLNESEVCEMIEIVTTI